MQASAVRQPGPRALPISLSQSETTTRTIPVMVSEAEYQRLRGARTNAIAAHEPIDRRLVELLDACD